MDIDPNGIFATNNTNPGGIDVTGATLQGMIKCTYDDLFHAFGNPIITEEDTEWLVKFNDFTVAKVYKTDLQATPPAQYWNIDGFSNAAFIKVSAAVQRSQEY